MIPFVELELGHVREGLFMAEAVEQLFWGLKFQHFREPEKIKFNEIKGKKFGFRQF